jgi:hypothetical protein
MSSWRTILSLKSTVAFHGAKVTVWENNLLRAGARQVGTIAINFAAPQLPGGGIPFEVVPSCH